ncbi:thermonuclease family protein (plasmid) [Microbacterium sp. WHRI 7836]|uniref:thermonuclease family protein n=1 Tax=Microbacterium sp. WHRI 7836 TaxID=3162563 RepID=UPI0032EEE1DE
MTARSCTLTIAAAAVALALTSCTPAEISTTPATSTVATVVAVVDGDTIDVQTSTGEERVRLIGIDTPEISRDGGADDCYAQEARTYLDQLVYGHDVELVSDPTQADTDRYGRLLRHVLIDGQSAAQLAIEAGAGTEYTYDTPYDRRSDHLAAQDRAQDASAGLWSVCP